MTLPFFEFDKIKAAIRAQEFTPYFQPQICSRTMRISGVEVLGRWAKDDALLLPDQFLPAAEAFDLMVDIDLSLYVLAEDVFEGMCNRGARVPRHSFNVTAKGLCDPRVVEFFKTGVRDPSAVSIEILESIALEEPQYGIDDAIKTLREIGYSIELDDFGSMHASLLAYIRLHPDRIKIDRRLVAAASRGHRFINVLRVVIDLAHSWGIEVIAEGVETDDQVKMLTDLGCDHFQGFYFLPPVNGATLETVVREFGTI